MLAAADRGIRLVVVEEACTRVGATGAEEVFKFLVFLLLFDDDFWLRLV